MLFRSVSQSRYVGWLKQEGVRVGGRLFDVQFAEALIDSDAEVALDVLSNKYLCYGKVTTANSLPPTRTPSCFNELSHVIIERDQIRSHDDLNHGAQHQCAGLPYENVRVNGDYLLKVKEFATKIDFVSHDNLVVIAGEATRGVISKLGVR